MKSTKQIIIQVISSLSVLLLMTACGETTATPTAAFPAESSATPTETPPYDSCAPENRIVEIKPVNDLMREFDDNAQLAVVVQVDQLVNVIPSLQAVRRRAEDQQVPDCLSTLKSLQLQEMNTFINTLLVFVQVRDTNSQTVAQGIVQAQSLHTQFNQEMARLVGATYVPETSTPTP
jgi:hypothetical protein